MLHGRKLDFGQETFVVWLLEFTHVLNAFFQRQ